ncbi:MAG TPA: glutathione peroxidase [Chitinophagales bacterium]|nr:glutathione peroxidase [Chitinophagales bacterium]
MKKIILFSLFTTILSVSCNDKIAKQSDITQIEQDSSKKTIFDFSMKDIDGENVSLSKYKGKVILVVNTASKCGLTPQYEDLQKLYEEYENKDFVILGFPANNFLSQEPGSDEDIKEFCSLNYGVSFPMFSKISVKGNDIDPLYKYLTNKDENGVLDASVSWNFQKFLINKNGVLVASFSPKTTVKDEDFLKVFQEQMK